MSSDANVKFGDLLREHRQSRGYSQEHLAERARMSVTAIGALERGIRRAPYRATVDMLANALELSAAKHAEFARAAARARARGGDKSPPATEPRSNIPVALTSFIGRTADIAKLGILLERNRLVTITGMGGIGKTRIALELAKRRHASYRRDIWFIDLTAVHGMSGIVAEIGDTLRPRLSHHDGSVDGLADVLKSRTLLLVLDNCEHVIDAAAAIARVILERCPDVRILATSRERLGIRGEALHRLASLTESLTLRLDDASDSRYDAIALFVDRARSVDPSFMASPEQLVAVGDICRRLDGLPLAIELAVAHLPTLGLRTLQNRLKERFVLSGGSRDLPARHRTMRAAIAWSYDLLTDDERILLRRLGVFSGGCSLAAAKIVCSETRLRLNYVAGLMVSLVDKSLVNAVVNGERTRYVLLNLTREFARERLFEAQEESTLCRRHAQWLSTYGEQALQEYRSQPNLVWLDAFFPEIDNVRSALEWTLRFELDEDVLLAGQIAGSFIGLWLVSGLYQEECRRLIEVILGQITDAPYTLVVADLAKALATTLTGSELLVVYDRLIGVLRQTDDGRRFAQVIGDTSQAYCRAGLLSKAQAALDEFREIIN